MAIATLATPATCIVCQGKGTLSVYSRIYNIEIILCSDCLKDGE